MAEKEREKKVSELKTEQEKIFMRSKFKNSKDGEFDAAIYAFKNWDKYGAFARDIPYSAIKNMDIDKFINTLQKDIEKMKPRTISQTLHYLGLFFKHNSRAAIAKYINQQKRKIDAQIRAEAKNKEPVSPNDIQNLYFKKIKPQYKIIIRLLILDNKQIPIKSLDKIYVERSENGNNGYRFDLLHKNEQGKDKLEKILINEETIKLATPLIEKNLANKDKNKHRLITTNTRSIDEQMKIYSEQACSRAIKPMDIVKFSRNRPQAELIKILQTKS